MPTMSNLRRRRIQAAQRKARNSENRVAKVAKKERNSTAGANVPSSKIVSVKKA